MILKGSDPFGLTLSHSRATGRIRSVTRAPEDEAFEQWRHSGDPAAMAELFDRAAPKLLLLASHWTRDPASAEDLVQTTFLQAVRDAASWDREQPVLAWLAGILAHRAQDLRRAEARRQRHVLQHDEPQTQEPDPLRAAIDSESMHHVLGAVESLPDPYRDALVLRLLHGLSSVQIAHALGRSPAAVRKQIERGLGMLRRMLPAGVAVSVLAHAEAAVGLAAAREAIVRAAASGVAGTVAPIVIGGALAMKKLVLGVVAAALLVSGALIVNAGYGSPSGNEPAADVAGAASAALGQETPAAGLEVAEKPTPEGSARAEAPAADPHGWVVVRLVEAGTETPVPGAAIAHTYFASPRRSAHETLVAYADAEGRARFGPFGPGSFVAHPFRGGSGRVQVATGSTEELRIDVPSARKLRGVVVHADGSPAAGAILMQTDDVGTRPIAIAGHADASGRFELLVKPTGPFMLGAELEGFVRSPLCGINQELEPAEIRLTLGRVAPERRVRIRDAAGNPVPHASLFLGHERVARDFDPVTRKASCNYMPHGKELHTDMAGMVTIRGLELSSPLFHRVAVKAQGFALLQTEIYWASRTEDPIELTLQRSALVRGVAYDGATGERAETGIGVEHGEYGSFGSIRTETDATGAFELHGLPLGEVRLVAWHTTNPGTVGNPGPKAVTTLTLRPDETSIWNPVLTTAAARIGFVVDPAGVPVASANVQMRYDNGSGAFETLTTDASGMFRLVRDIRDGAASLEVRMAGDGVIPRAARTIRSIAEWRSDTITIERGHSMTLGLELACEGIDVDRVTLGISRVGTDLGYAIRPRPQAPGRWELKLIPPGRYQFELWRDATDPQRRRLLARSPEIRLAGGEPELRDRIELRCTTDGTPEACKSTLGGEWKLDPASAK